MKPTYSIHPDQPIPEGWSSRIQAVTRLKAGALLIEGARVLVDPEGAEALFLLDLDASTVSGDRLVEMAAEIRAVRAEESTR